MVESDLGATRLGQMLYELASDLSNKAKITSALSSTTIYKRTAFVWAYFRDAPGSYRSRLHLSEAKAYEYVSKLRGSAGPSVPKHFIECLGFFSPLLRFLRFELVDVLSPE